MSSASSSLNMSVCESNSFVTFERRRDFNWIWTHKGFPSHTSTTKNNQAIRSSVAILLQLNNERSADLAKESIEQDSAEMIPTIIDSCTEYVSSNDMEVPKWIERKGGWKQLLNVKDTTAVVTAVSTSPPSPKITVTSLRGNTSRMMSGRDQSTMIYFIFSAVVVFMTVIVSCVWYGKGLNHRPIWRFRLLHSYKPGVSFLC